jgi:putative transposase
MRPTKAQESILNRLAGARRWVWDWGLRRWKDYFEAHGKSIGLEPMSAELTALKQQPETAWLKEADSQSLQQTLKDLRRAFGNLFEERARYPKFKSRKRDPLRSRIPQRVEVADGKVYVPKVGQVRIHQSRPATEATKSATFRRAADGHWYVSLVVEFEMHDVALPPVDPSRVVGIDLGLKDCAVSSDGERIPAPKFFREGARKLRKAQRIVSRRKPGSNRKARARKEVARVHQKIADRRGDFLHKLTTDLVNHHGGLCIEDLSVEGLARTKLAKSMLDASMGEFRGQVEYKSLWGRKHLSVIDRYFPSSRLHGECGEVNDRLTLADRTWTCGCGAIIDRDLNAAVNIRDEGLRTLAVGQTESLNARGARVRLATASNGC